MFSKKKQTPVELKVLLVAPTVERLDSSPEIKALTALQRIRVAVLTGYVSAQNVYEAVDRNNYDIVYFAVHSDSEHIALNGTRLSSESIGQIAKLAGASVIFFNSCNSGKHASFLVQRGVQWAIFLNIELRDEQAWRMPLLFFDLLNKQIMDSNSYSIPKAFFDAIPGDGTYGITAQYDRAGFLPVMHAINAHRIWLYALTAGAMCNVLLMAFLLWELRRFWGW